MTSRSSGVNTTIYRRGSAVPKANASGQKGETAYTKALKEEALSQLKGILMSRQSIEDAYRSDIRGQPCHSVVVGSWDKDEDGNEQILFAPFPNLRDRENPEGWRQTHTAQEGGMPIAMLYWNREGRFSPLGRYMTAWLKAKVELFDELCKELDRLTESERTKRVAELKADTVSQEASDFGKWWNPSWEIHAYPIKGTGFGLRIIFDVEAFEEAHRQRQEKRKERERPQMAARETIADLVEAKMRQVEESKTKDEAGFQTAKSTGKGKGKTKGLPELTASSKNPYDALQ